MLRDGGKISSGCKPHTPFLHCKNCAPPHKYICGRHSIPCVVVNVCLNIFIPAFKTLLYIYFNIFTCGPHLEDVATPATFSNGPPLHFNP